MAPGPRRLRRQSAADSGQLSIWDAALGGTAAGSLFAEAGVKKSNVGPLLRALVESIANAPLGVDLRSDDSSSPTTTEERWRALGVTGETLVELGLPRRAVLLLKAVVPFSTRLVAEPRTSADGSTSKLLLSLRDGQRVETVVMRHEQRTTVCVSSQIGCQMGCTFCATGTMSTVSDLDSGEILEQLLHAHVLEVTAGRPRVRSAVFMGMGEPLNNYDAVLRAARLMTDVGHLGKYALPPAKVTISTVGVTARILQLAHDLPAVNLALSLHAPTQELRERIVPAARHTPLPELLAALDEHAARCSRPMVEYCLLAGVNDTDTCAVELGKLMGPRAPAVMVNLIPYNPGANSELGGFEAPGHQTVDRFQRIVAAFGVTVRVRREMGKDIFGACGQLALTQARPDAGIKHSKIVDLEDDFMAWRRSRPGEEKAAVSAECVALAVAAGATGQFIDLMLPHRTPESVQARGLDFLLSLATPAMSSAAMAAVGTGAMVCLAFWGRHRLRVT